MQAKGLTDLTCISILSRSSGATAVLAKAPAAPPAINSLTYTGNTSTAENFTSAAAAAELIVDSWEVSISRSKPIKKNIVVISKISRISSYPACNLANSLSHRSLGRQKKKSFRWKGRRNKARTTRN